MSRFNAILLTAVTLFGSTAAALPQSAGSGGTRATTVRSRCPGCSISRDRQERLLLKIDSLRRVIDSGRLSDSERELAAREIALSVNSLQALLDETMRAEAAVVAGMATGPVRPARAPMPVPRVTVVAVEPFQPRGYLGVTFDGPHAEMRRDDAVLIRFYQHPKIALVESSSPAERAGVREGDTLLALNGTDVKNETLNLTKLLVPEARIVMRVRRDGDNKDLRVTVAEAPEYLAWRATPLPRAPRAPVPADQPVTVRIQEPPTPPVVYQAPSQARLWVYNEGVAGAHVETVSEGLGKALGIKEGVLVIRVQPGTPAFQSGLQDGDVILSVDGRSVTTVRTLRRLLADGEGDRGVKLTILRERKQRDVTLRW
jgi:S1-C subfamily serine protease